MRFAEMSDLMDPMLREDTPADERHCTFEIRQQLVFGIAPGPATISTYPFRVEKGEYVAFTFDVLYLRHAAMM
jgi:hypothetical protein